MNKIKQDAVAIWKAGVAAVDARKLVRDFVRLEPNKVVFGEQSYQLDKLRRIIVIGFGKCSGGMAVGLQQALGNVLSNIEVQSQINVPDDQVVETIEFTVEGCRPKGQNLPNQRVVDATEKAIQLVKNATPDDLIICLVSGGGSALLEKPTPPITLDELCQTTKFLSNAGASIYELNAVRRAISEVKAGRLAELSKAPLVSLIVSDVIGNDLAMIASGPTYGGQAESKAEEVLARYDINHQVLPKSIREAIRNRRASRISASVHHFVIGDVSTAITAAGNAAIELGYRVERETPNGNEGDAEEVGRSIADELIRQGNDENPNSTCVISGGETTVNVSDDPGFGGRNQHLILAALEQLLASGITSPAFDFCLLSGGTDGEDGSLPASMDRLCPGACLDHSDLKRLAGARQELKKALAECDSHSFVAANNLLFQLSGSTWTNVCDLRVRLVSS